MESWDDTHGPTHLRRVSTEQPTNTTDTIRPAIVDPLAGGDSQLTTNGKQHSQRVPAAEHQDQSRQWGPTADNSNKAHRSLDPHYIIWDCASGTNICKNPGLATNIKTCKPATMLGIVQGSEGVYTQSCSFLNPTLGRCPLAENSIANIMSQAVALDSGFQVQYASDSDRFIVKHPTDSSVQYVFGRLTGTKGLTKHYLRDSRTMMPPTMSGHHNTHTLLGKLRDCVGVDPVEQRDMEYTKNQIASAAKAMEFMKPSHVPTITPDHAPREADPEYFNIINAYVRPTHITTGTSNHFWSVVGGQHDTNMISTLDSLALRTTAATLAWNHSEHDNASKFSKAFHSIEQATDWQSKMHASLRDNGWRLQALTRAPELEGSGWCWTRPRPKYQSSGGSTSQTSQPEVERDHHPAQPAESTGPSTIESNGDDDYSSGPDGEDMSCPGLANSDDSGDDSEGDDGEPPGLISTNQTCDSAKHNVITTTNRSPDKGPPPPNRGGHEVSDIPPPNRGEHDEPNIPPFNRGGRDAAGVPPPNRGGHDGPKIFFPHGGEKRAPDTHIRRTVKRTPVQDRASAEPTRCFARMVKREEKSHGSHVGAGEGTCGIPEREEGNEPDTYNEDEYDEGLTNSVEYVFGVAAGKTAFAEHDDAAPKPIRKETFTATLNNHGYTANPYDPCIFNTVDEEGDQCTRILYVDDLCVTCKHHGMIETTITEHLGVERSHTDTRKHRKSSNPTRRYKAAITSATSDGMNEDRRGVS